MPTYVLRASLDLLNILIKVKVCLKMFDGAGCKLFNLLYIFHRRRLLGNFLVCSQVRDGLLKEKQARVEKARWERLSHWGKV